MEALFGLIIILGLLFGQPSSMTNYPGRDNDRDPSDVTVVQPKPKDTTKPPVVDDGKGKGKKDDGKDKGKGKGKKHDANHKDNGKGKVKRPHRKDKGKRDELNRK
jgi:hypothetical protein